MTGGYATAREIGGTAFVTRVLLQDDALTGYGVAVSAFDRVEVSLARQDFKTYSNLAPLSPAFAGLHLKQDIVGVKVRLQGDAVLDSDTWVPQVAAGVEFKRLGSSWTSSAGCHLHSSMRGTLFVTDTPHFAKTDARGVAVLANLPQGPAELRLWHADQLTEQAPAALSVGGTALSVTPKLNFTPRRRR